MRNSMIFYRSFYDAAKDLPEDARLQLYDAIFCYGLDQVEPKLTGVASSFFKLIKPNLQANIEKYKNGSKPKTKQIRSKIEANNKQIRSKTEGNVDVDVDVDVDKDNDKDKNADAKGKQQEESAPTLQDVIQFCSENSYNQMLAEKIFAHYHANGWTASDGSKLKDWKAAARKWFKDEYFITQAEKDNDARRAKYATPDAQSEPAYNPSEWSPL